VVFVAARAIDYRALQIHWTVFTYREKFPMCVATAASPVAAYIRTWIYRPIRAFSAEKRATVDSYAPAVEESAQSNATAKEGQLVRVDRIGGEITDPING
jgi:hypothetical protein